MMFAKFRLLILLGLLSFAGAPSSLAALIIGGTATFTFNEALSGASTPLNSLDAVFTGTQSRAETLTGLGDPFDSITGSEKTVTFSINGASPATIVGRPNNAATTLNYNSSNLLGDWLPGADSGAFLSGGSQIGLQSMTRWSGNFTGSLIFGDFAIRYAPGRVGGARSGLVLTSNIDFANATYADLANMTTTLNPTSFTIVGDLLYSNGFALLTGDPSDVGVKFGTFRIDASTVPEPTSVCMLAVTALSSVMSRRRCLPVRYK